METLPLMPPSVCGYLSDAGGERLRIPAASLVRLGQPSCCFTWTPVVRDPTALAATALDFVSAASADKLAGQLDCEDPDQWWRALHGSDASATSSAA